MANHEHLEILKQGVEVWNKWRANNRSISPDLSGAYLSGADFSGADLSGVGLSGADLGGANLSGADLSGADLNGAYLRGAHLRGAHLRRAHLVEADLGGADLGRAHLRWADLSRARLREAELVEADLGRAGLVEADLRWANLLDANLSKARLCEAELRGANLRLAVCEQADFSDAKLTEACLIRTNFNGATLSGAWLWETQRTRWIIKGVVCKSVYWDSERKDITNFAPGEFERLYSEKIRVLVKYPKGVSPLEIITLPALIQHLEASRPGCHLRFESIQEASGGAVVTIVVEEVDGASPKRMEQLGAEIQSEAEQSAQFLRQTLEGKGREVSELQGEVRALERMIKALLSELKPAYYLEKGDIKVSEFKNTIGGNFQGAMGDNAQTNNLTYNEIGNHIEKSMDLSQLAAELSKLHQAMKQEATEADHYHAIGEVVDAEKAAQEKDSSKVAESLKAAGKWALEVASKIGVSLATDALKHSIGMGD